MTEGVIEHSTKILARLNSIQIQCLKFGLSSSSTQDLIEPLELELNQNFSIIFRTQSQLS